MFTLAQTELDYLKDLRALRAPHCSEETKSDKNQMFLLLQE